MYVLTDSNTNVVIKISEECTPVHPVNGEEVETTVEEATGYLFKSENVIYPKGLPCEMYVVDEVPAEVEIMKYCYTAADGFTVNEDYVTPPPTIEEQIAELSAKVEYMSMCAGISLEEEEL